VGPRALSVLSFLALFSSWAATATSLAFCILHMPESGSHQCRCSPVMPRSSTFLLVRSAVSFSALRASVLLSRSRPFVVRASVPVSRPFVAQASVPLSRSRPFRPFVAQASVLLCCRLFWSQLCSSAAFFVVQASVPLRCRLFAVNKPNVTSSANGPSVNLIITNSWTDIAQRVRDSVYRSHLRTTSSWFLVLRLCSSALSLSDSFLRLSLTCLFAVVCSDSALIIFIGSFYTLANTRTSHASFKL
jgi:hypothetical protein